MQLLLPQCRLYTMSCRRNAGPRLSMKTGAIQSKRNQEQTADSVTSAGRPPNPEKELVETAQQASDRQDSNAQQDMSGKDIGEQLASFRKDEGATGLFQGVLEETRLISWPAPLQAVKDTVTVVAVVGLAALLLFGLNSGLTEGSKLLYRLKFR